MSPHARSIGSFQFCHLISHVGKSLFEKLSNERGRRLVRRTRSLLFHTLTVVLGILSLVYVELRLGGKLTTILLWDSIVFGAGTLVYWIADRLRFRHMSRTALAHMKRRQEEPDQLAAPHWRDYPLSDETRSIIDAARGDQEEFLLAPIDMSGRAMCAYGILPFVPSVSADGFSPRDRYNIDIVLHGDMVLLRKSYRGNWRQCVREWFNLEQMYMKARVPVVRKVDVARGVLYMDYIYSRTLLEIFRDNGALMRDSDVEHDASFVGLSGEERQRKLDQRGQAVLGTVFPEEFLCKVDSLIEDIHRCRVSDLDIRFANIIRDDSGTPWMIDFHDARTYPDWAEYLFRFKRDGDIQSYARVFGRTLRKDPLEEVTISADNTDSYGSETRYTGRHIGAVK